MRHLATALALLVGVLLIAALLWVAALEAYRTQE
jgi:hypothetical protein